MKETDRNNIQGNCLRNLTRHCNNKEFHCT